MMSAVNQRRRSEVHPLPHELRKPFNPELQLLIPLWIDAEKRNLPRSSIRPHHHICARRPAHHASGFALNSISNFCGGLNRLHHLTHATERPRYVIPNVAQCVSFAWLH